MAIHPYNNQHETNWNKGLYQVVIKAHGHDRPFGYCDGSDEDRRQLLEMAENEGMTNIELVTKPLKNDREVWTLKGNVG